MRFVRCGAALALALFAAAPASTQPAAQMAAEKSAQAMEAIEVFGPLQPGGLLFVKPPSGTRALMVDGKPVPAAPDGRYLVGLPREAQGRLVLEAERPAGQTIRLALVVPRRDYRIQRLPALGTTDTPGKEWLERRAREVARITSAKQAAAADPRASSGYTQPFIRPAPGRISGVYGSQRVFGGLPRAPHWGLDIANATGTPIRAPADGIVRLADGPFLLEGNSIVLDHGAGVVTLYIHLDRLAVKTGDRVKKGDRLGTIGTTGRSTGPHLHWGLSLMRPADTAAAFEEIRLDPALLLP